jgi:hypothetical protein
MPIQSLRCFRCGAEYSYVGSDVHPGRCPECDSPCVPPAGRLTVEGCRSWESANGLSKIWIQARDDQGRTFEYEVAANDDRGALAGLAIDGIRLDLPHTELGGIPPEIDETLAQFGVTELPREQSLRT